MFEKFFGYDKLHANIKSIVRKYIFLQAFYRFSLYFTYPFLILYYIQTFGVFKAGILMSIYSLILLSTDFVTGALSDYIGQRNTLILGALFQITFFYLIIIANKNFLVFIIAIIFNGLDFTLESGTLPTWFNNSYKELVDYDSNRKIYGFLVSRIRTITVLAVSFGVLVGSNVVFYFSYKAVFQVSIVLYFLIIVLLSIFLKIKKEDKITGPSPANQESLIRQIINTVKYVVKTKHVFYLIIGYTLWVSSIGAAFNNLVLYLIEYGYTGNAQLFGIVESIMTLITVVTAFISSYYIHKVKTTQIQFFAFMFNLVLFSGLIVIIIFFPLNNTFNLLPILLLILLLFITQILFSEFVVNSFSRITIDAYPSKYRNGIMSLLTSIISFFAVILFPIISYVISITNFINALVIFEFIGFAGSFFLFLFNRINKKVVIEPTQ